jgi:hypothetical protein
MRREKMKNLVNAMKELGFQNFNHLDALVIYNTMRQKDKLAQEATPVMTQAGKEKFVEMGYENANKLDAKLVFTKLAA